MSERQVSPGASVSVIIVSWNVRDALEECLEAVQAEGSGAVTQTIVVDNASGDGSPDAAARFPGVTVIRNDDNRGFARACNQGLHVARGTYCTLLNPDTRVCPGALGSLAAFLEETPRAGAAGPMLLNPDGSLQPNGGPFPRLHASLLRTLRVSSRFRGWYDRSYRWGRGDFSQAWKVDQVSGACLMLRRAAIEQVGLLDERFFLYYEEVDWLLRASRAGWETYYVPSARVVHRWAASTSQVSDRALSHMRRSETLYFRKHRGPVLGAASLALGTLELTSHRLARRFRGSPAR